MLMIRSRGSCRVISATEDHEFSRFSARSSSSIQGHSSPSNWHTQTQRGRVTVEGIWQHSALPNTAPNMLIMLTSIQ